MLSKRIRAVPPSGTVALADVVKAKKAAGERVVDLTVGEPDFPTPAHVVAAAKAALDAGRTKYGPSMGVLALREAIARRHTERRATPTEVANVMVTPAKHALLTFFLTVLDPGDEVLIPTPAWVSYAPQVLLCGGKPVEVRLTPEGRLDLERLKEATTPRTRALVLNSPSNPTGGVLPEEDLRGALDLTRDAGAWVLSDEIYADLTYDGVEAPSPAALQGSLEGVAIVDGVSKGYAMTGWRIGWLLGPETLVKAANKVQQHSVTHPTLFAQDGAVAALTGDQACVAEMRATFEARRDKVTAALGALEATFPQPKGAFYVFPRFASHDSGEKLAMELLEKAGVAVTPGEAFGPGGEGHVRVSYAASDAELDAALDGLAKVVG